MASMRALGVLSVLVIGCAEGNAISGSGGGGSGGTIASGGSNGGSGGVASTSSGSQTSSSVSSSGSNATSSSTSGAQSSSSTGGPMPTACPANQFATGIDANGDLICGALTTPVKTAINASCSAYLGWRDSCSGCSTPPAKWGSARGDACSVGVGVNNTCAATTLGGNTLQLMGLNPDGDVDDNDKLYAGFSCTAGATTPSAGPCEAGELVTTINGSSVTCTPIAGTVVDFVRNSCSLYFGIRDSCDGCTTPPAKWGRVSSTACANGAGSGNTCTVATLGGNSVQLFGLDADGDVDDNDKLYFGLHCAPPAPATVMANGTCPAGQFVTASDGNGSVTCTSPNVIAHQVFQSSCTLYAGARDDCDGCTTAPAKWGRVRDGFCAADLGVNDTCASTILGADTLQLFGLNTDGDVDDNDKLYLGLKCL